MSNEIQRQYLEKVRIRYLKGNKKQKTLILDEFTQVCEISRKHAIKLLNEDLRTNKPRPGPKVTYGPNIHQHIVTLWQKMGCICSKKISASSIDRILSKYRDKIKKGISSTEPSMIKNKIPIKLLDEAVKEPGFIEADTVAHCGMSLAGEFINTLTMTDLFSSWTENRAVWKKEAVTVMGAISSIEKALPFAVKGFATDNGNEFLNHDLHSYFFNRKNRVEFVRRRPYKKNDNAHVEQKNWTHVRELFGYDRFEHLSQVEWMNDVYQRLWNPLWNYFTPVMKLQSKTRIGGKIIKVYDDLKTPYQRLIDSCLLTPEQTVALENEFKKLNPFELKKELEEKLKWFFRIAEIRRNQTSDAG